MTRSQKSRFGVSMLLILVAAFLILPRVFSASPLPLAGSASRTATFTRETKQETFRNPQFSSGLVNRFLYTLGPKALVGGGGDSLKSPATRGYGSADAPPTLWLPNEGRVEWGDTDLSLPGVGLPLSFQRIWRGSVTSYNGPLGLRWDFNWNKRLLEEVDSDVVFYEMGRVETYDESSGSYTSPAGRYDTLEKDTTPNPDVFTRTDKWGVVETYEDEGSGWFRLSEIEDLNGNTLSFSYNGSSQLTTVTDSLAQDTTLTYDVNGRITKVTDHDSRDWSYAYDGSDRLSTVTTPISTVTTYSYDGSDRLTAVHLPEDGEFTDSFTWTYNGSGEVVTQSTNGADFTMTYNTTLKKTTVTDREANEVRYLYNSGDLITSRALTIGATDYTTSFAYNSDAEVTLVTFPRDNQVAYTYDGDGNILTVKFLEDENDTTPVTWTYTYTTNSRLDTLDDPNGNTWEYDYDGAGNLTKVTAPAVTLPTGIATADNNGNSTYDGTIETSYTYGSTGLVASMTDPVGTLTDYTYTTVNSKSAYLNTVKKDSGTGTLNLVTTYAYDDVGNLTSTTDPEGNVTTRTVDKLNRVTAISEPLGVTKTTTYDDNNRVIKTQVTNDTTIGNTLYIIEYEYDASNHLTKVKKDIETGVTLDTTYTNDDNDRRISVTSPEGQVTASAYDARGQRASNTREAAAGNLVSEIAYDGNGNVVSRTDPLDHVTSYTYDDLDRLIKVTDAEDHYRTMEYDTAGNLTKTSHFNSSATKLAETTQSFDQANRAYKTERLAREADLITNLGDGLQTKTIWRDERGAVLESSGDICGCSAWEFTYDAVGRQISKLDPMTDQNEVTSEYDDNGNLTKRTLKDASQDTGLEADKDIVTEYVYDARNRRTKTKDKLSASVYAETVYTYGKRDQLTQITDPEGRVKKYERNEQLWKTKETAETAGADVITEFTYDDDGNLATRKAKNSTTGDQTTSYTYDDFDRLTTTTWPDSGTTVQTYDDASNRLNTTDPNGTLTACAYDDNNRLLSKDITLATNVIGTDAIDYTYDGMGRMLSADAAEGTSFTSVLDWTYNTLGKRETETQIIDGNNSGNGYTLTYTWNETGQKTAVAYPFGGDSITYTRDELDRVDSISRGGTEVVDYTFSGRRVLRKEFPGSEALYAYDYFGRLAEIEHKDLSSGNLLATFDYGYDDSHMAIWMDKGFYNDVTNTRILADTSDKGDQYAYDGAGRLETVLRGVPSAFIDTAMATNITNDDFDDRIDYLYDQTGNRTSWELDETTQESYTHNTVNEMTVEGGVTQTYDANGNLTGASNVHKYQANNQLASFYNGTKTLTWHRDALGRQIQRDKSGSPSKLRNYYDGQHRVEATVWNGTVEEHRKTWVYGERIDEMLLEVNVIANPDKLYYAHADRLGSIMVLAEPDGDIAESYRYTEFGEQTVVNSSFVKLSGGDSPVGNAVRYTGRWYAGGASRVGETWYDYRARHYRAGVGRFVQRDSAGYVDGANHYAYVKSRPTDLTDPTGELSIWPLFPGLTDLLRQGGCGGGCLAGNKHGPGEGGLEDLPVPCQKGTENPVPDDAACAQAFATNEPDSSINYCGTMEDPISWAEGIPQLQQACFDHDRCYCCGGGEAEQASCDQKFSDAAKAWCESTGSTPFACNLTVDSIVSQFEDDAFNWDD